MIGPLWPQPAARSVGPPESGALGLRRRHVESLLSPDGLHAILPHVPALAGSQPSHGALAIPPVLFRQRDDSLPHPLLTRVQLGHVPIAGPDLADRPTRSTLRHVQHRHRMPHCVASAGRAQQCPAAISFTIDRSRAWSATMRVSR